MLTVAQLARALKHGFLPFVLQGPREIRYRTDNAEVAGSNPVGDPKRAEV